jgi:hypothetical protein
LAQTSASTRHGCIGDYSEKTLIKTALPEDLSVNGAAAGEKHQTHVIVQPKNCFADSDRGEKMTA